MLTGLLLIAGLFFAAPAPAHADPTPPPPSSDPSKLPDGTQKCAGPLQLVCNATDAVVGTAQSAVGAVGGAIDFVKNPLGYLAAAWQGAATGFMGWISTMSNQATQPDLSADWWLQTYRAGMAIGIVLLGFVLLYEILQVARRKSSADDLMETMSIWIPAFFAGIIFGPALAQFIINGAGFLTDGLIRSLAGFGGSDAYNAISKAAANSSWFGPASAAQGASQALMAMLVAFGILVAAVVVFVSLCLQAVILYMASAVFAIGWVWIVTNRHRENAWKIPRLIIGIAFGKALLFLLLGIALSLATAASSFGGDGALKDMGLVVMGISAMLLAAFAPLILLRHAPVIPGTGTSRHTQDSASAAGQGKRSVSRGGKSVIETAKTGGNKLNAIIASRADKKAAPPPGAPAGPGRVIDAPIPSGTSGVGSSTPRPSQSSGTAPKPAPAPIAPQGPRPGRPVSGSQPTSDSTLKSFGGGSPRRAPAPATGFGAGVNLPADAPSNYATSRPSPRQPRGRQPRPASARQVPDHDYVPPSDPPPTEEQE